MKTRVCLNYFVNGCRSVYFENSVINTNNNNNNNNSNNNNKLRKQEEREWVIQVIIF